MTEKTTNDISGLSADDKRLLAYLLSRLEDQGLIDPANDLLYFERSGAESLLIYGLQGRAGQDWVYEGFHDSFELNKNDLTIEYYKIDNGRPVPGSTS